MVKTLKKVSHSGQRLASGFVTGLAAAVSITGVGASHQLPRTDRSPADALRGDWERLGGDMRRAVERTAPRGSKQ